MSNLDIVKADLLAGSTTIAALLDTKDATIASQAALIATLQGQVPPTPPPPPPPGGQSIVLQNMTLNGGVYRSNNLAADGKCYLQVRVQNAPQHYAKLTVTRKTNVIPDGHKNLKFMRVWPDGSYPNDYAARSLNTGAEQVSTEQGNASKYFTMPFVNGVAKTEIYEFDYDNKTFKIWYDGSLVCDQSNWNYGGAPNRTQYGVQLVYAPNTGDSGALPGGSYVEFTNPLLEVR